MGDACLWDLSTYTIVASTNIASATAALTSLASVPASSTAASVVAGRCVVFAQPPASSAAAAPPPSGSASDREEWIITGWADGWLRCFKVADSSASPPPRAGGAGAAASAKPPSKSLVQVWQIPNAHKNGVNSVVVSSKVIITGGGVSVHSLFFTSIFPYFFSRAVVRMAASASGHLLHELSSRSSSRTRSLSLASFSSLRLLR